MELHNHAATPRVEVIIVRGILNIGAKETIATVDIPDAWNVKKIDRGNIQAMTKDEETYIFIEELK